MGGNGAQVGSSSGVKVEWSRCGLRGGGPSPLVFSSVSPLLLLLLLLLLLFSSSLLTKYVACCWKHDSVTGVISGENGGD